LATLLTIIQNVTDRIGLKRPAVVVGSADQQVRELLVFAKQEGVELMKAVPWQELTKEHSFTTVAADAQTDSIPSDWDRFLNDSIYNRTSERKIWGPITAQEWQQRKAYTTASTIDYWFRVRGDTILMTPQPAAGESVYYEYISEDYCQATGGGATKAEWSVDTDVSLLPANLFELGIEWRWRKAKGLEWQTPFQQYSDQLNKRAVTQKGAPTLQAGGRASAFNRPNVPEGNWS
jgi:hypothetical protein